ncbi:piggyBac transposable element-derived protein 4-like [Pectinophora gossypiella]|nr:piggyBac transposable element-derived protein 4-like [Pectinophora gossypiella]
MESIATETNRFAWQHIAPHFEVEDELAEKSRLRQWADTSVGELYKLFSVLLLMGMCVRGRLDEYWSTGILGMPGFRKIMQKDRFLLLMRFLHFADNNTIHHGDDKKLAKIRPLLEHLNKKFADIYSPRREMSIDESLLLWKGRISWMQCIRSKAARFGIKTYELCEAVSGYVLKVIIYTGKGTLPRASVFGFSSSTAKIVLELFKDYLGRGFTLFMDNFYNSIALTRFLKSKKTDVVGTLNRRRVDCPQDIKAINEKRMERGAVVSRHCGDVSVVAWKDVKLVTTVSTYHNADMAQGRRAGQAIMKPNVIHEYNKFMGGVDLKDQKLSMYLLERKRGIKWYIKVFRRLFNVSILNCYIIYCSNIGQGQKMSHRQFRYLLAEELCAQTGANVATRQRQNITSTRLDRSLDHTPEHLCIEGERTLKQVRFQRGRCVRCAAKKERGQTNIQCSNCKVFLCVGQCWREYHSLDNL